ncbi:MAG TPA: hypothetical protein VFZ09_46405 [Archangium sp.]|uniref:hypothetical protein n=1 Tax=Archangium sp. TaxID=1872627 RepID=UPI002E341FA7|nr:hypothetical protein [Archangium sp.]HEX5753711.1 hypothetical protein [Archangium sp.]
MISNAYVDQCVYDLSMCVATDQFQAVIGRIQRELTASNTDDATRQWFWSEVQKRYAKAPKIRLDDTTAARRLFDLHAVASQMLAAAAQRK